MKRNLMNELKEGIDALAERRNIMNEKDFNDLITSVKEAGAILRNEKYQEELEEIEQILGKALGYPWYKDDLKNFPNATEADGVCIAPDTAASLAMEAADRIKVLGKRDQDHHKIIDSQEEEIKVLREGLSLAASNIGNGSGASSQASLEFLTVEVPAEIKLVCENYRREIKFLKDRNEKLSKRHPTTEEALAQYHWLKENSKRNK